MALENIRISTKLPIFAIAAILLTGAILSTLLLVQARDGFEEMAESKLQALATARQSELSNYLGIIEHDLNVQAQSPTSIIALKTFKNAWGSMSGDRTEKLHKSYITDNPNPAGEKHKLDMGKNRNFYDTAHKKYHPYFRTLMEENGYYDIFLLDPEGNVVYSVYKEADYATNVKDGKWSKSDLGTIFTLINADIKSTKASFTDFHAYAPSAGVPASFIGRPVIDPRGKFIGSIVYQMPVGEINRIMQASEGMGESGETYIVGDDLLMRSDSRFAKESTILKSKIDSPTVHAALKGEKGAKIIDDYRGVPVISAYAPIEFNGVTWAIIAEVDLAEAMTTANSIQNTSLIIVGVISIVGAVISLWFAKSITNPITHIVQAMTKLAGGDAEVDIPYSTRKDEVGDMAGAVEVFKQNRLERIRLEAEEEKRLKQRTERQRKTAELTKQFDQDVTQTLGKVTTSVESMHTAANTLSANAEQTQQQSATVSAATEEATTNVQTVSAASTELTASIDEISRQVNDSMTILEDAVVQANSANEKIESLSTSAAKIGEVISLINDIAEQTNLLALNATIESARAGEAGKGFAVVASEVKNLAGQTSRATDEIGAQVKAVQAETEEAVKAIRSITGVITRINEMETAIAGAVEEQNASTAEIARNVEEAAKGTQDVSDNITGVATAAHETGEMAATVYNSASELLEESDSLRQQVETFLKAVHDIQNQGQNNSSAA